jgi:hypothetical protein
MANDYVEFILFANRHVVKDTKMNERQFGR